MKDQRQVPELSMDGGGALSCQCHHGRLPWASPAGKGCDPSSGLGWDLGCPTVTSGSVYVGCAPLWGDCHGLGVTCHPRYVMWVAQWQMDLWGVMGFWGADFIPGLNH